MSKDKAVAPAPTPTINTEVDLLSLLQTRLCRFCSGPSTRESPFIVVCACQGPNSATHAACLEAYLESERSHNRKRCDVCCREYQFTTKARSPLEWVVLSLSSSDQVGHSSLPQLLQLIARTMNVIFFLVLSLALIYSTTTDFDGNSSLTLSSKSSSAKPEDRNKGGGSSWLQINCGLAIIVFSLLRLVWVLSVLREVAWETWAQMKAWLADNPKVTLKVTSPKVTSDGSGTPAGAQPKKEAKNEPEALKLMGRSTTRAAGLKLPAQKKVIKNH